MASLIGQRLGNYEIIGLLGKGGMATVYRARQLNIKREVAIKIIKPDLAETEVFAKRFEREAETIATLSHPHILKLFDYGYQDNLVYLVTEILVGGTLADFITKGPLSLASVNTILGQITSALDYAHNLGIVHRDLKPQNVLLDAQGNAFLTDFGIAKLVQSKANTALTDTGAALGTPFYMAPEQWQGLTPDARTDIYALGIMLYEMLAGQPPFNIDTPANIMYFHLQQLAPSIQSVRSDLPNDLDGIIATALAKNPDDRFASCGAMASALNNLVTGHGHNTASSHNSDPALVDFSSTVQLGIGSETGSAASTKHLDPRIGQLRQRINTQFLSVPDQKILLFDLKELLKDPITAVDAKALLKVLYQREDLVARIANEIQEMLGGLTEHLPLAPTRKSEQKIPRVALFGGLVVLAILGVFVLRQPAASPTTPTQISGTLSANMASTSVPASGTAVAMAPLGDTGSSKIAFTSDRNSVDEINSVDLTGTNLITLRTDSYKNDQPMFSPDGKLVVYTSQVDGNLEVYLMNANGSDPRNLSTNPANDFGGVFSPDGSKIAFISNRDSQPESNTYISEIYLMDANGENQQRLTSLGFRSIGITWSADNKRIAFQSGQNATGGLYSVEVETNAIKRLTKNTLDESPAYSPDGKLIAFDSYRDGNYELLLMDADGQNERQLTDTKTRWNRLPKWSPDGKLIVFMSQRDGLGDIYTLEVNSGTVSRVTTNEDVNGYKDAPSFAPDGKTIIFHTRHTVTEIAVMDLVTKTIQTLVKQTPLFSSFSWSPDGQQITFAMKQGETTNIYIMDVAGAAPPQQVSRGYYDISPAWSPDGKRIVYAGYVPDVDKANNIYIVNVDGTNAQRLTTDDAGNYQPVWSPDGQQIAFMSYRDEKNGEVYVMQADGSKQTRLLNNTDGDTSPRWSPDGQQLVFTSIRSRNQDIYIINVSGSGVRRLTTDPAYEDAADWSPNHKYVAFLSNRSGTEQIYVMDADGSNQRQLTQGTANVQFPRWQPRK